MKEHLKKQWRKGIGMGIVMTCISLSSFAQNDSLPATIHLNDAINYAIQNQPRLQNALLNETVTEKSIRAKLADWYPQLNFNYLLQHNFEVQPTFFNGQVMRLGVENTSNASFTARQNIFNRDALLASSTKNIVREIAQQNTFATKVDLVANVTKAYYSLLSSQQQVLVTEGDIARLERSLKDATSQYVAGLTDKTDYKRATIALNNSKALLAARIEEVNAKSTFLKYLMGYPTEQPVVIAYDSLALENEIVLDTTLEYNYDRRIEFQQLSTQRRLQEANVRYNKWSYLPEVYANGAYNFNFLNNDFGKLYNQALTNSFAAITVAVPIFQGGKRKYNTDIAKIQLNIIDNNLRDLKNNINNELMQAKASYKANLANYLALKENLAIAQEVYDVINLQYQNGIKTYLEVINAETDLRNARINYYNALYLVLSSKVDVQRALGTLVN